MGCCGRELHALVGIPKLEPLPGCLRLAVVMCRPHVQELPDQLRGEAWAFVQLPLGVLREELCAVEAGQAFGAAFPLASAGLADLPDEAMVPGARQGQQPGCLCSVVRGGLAMSWAHASHRSRARSSPKRIHQPIPTLACLCWPPSWSGSYEVAKPISGCASPCAIASRPAIRGGPCGKIVPRAGVAVYSARAEPLAAWTAGWELANLAADADRACLVLETGVNQRWRYGSYRRTPENTAEARAWQDAKGAVRCALHGLRAGSRVLRGFGCSVCSTI